MPLIGHSDRFKPHLQMEARMHGFEEAWMRKLIDVVLIGGFLILDWLRFHDIFKPEVPTAADWLTGALSLLVFYVAIESLIRRSVARRAGEAR
jgi:hypothetical protein